MHTLMSPDGMIYLIAKVCVLLAVLMLWFATTSSPAT
jgi:hypothetical protein